MMQETDILRKKTMSYEIILHPFLDRNRMQSIC